MIAQREAKTYKAVLSTYARHAPYYERKWRHYNGATIRATLEVIPWGKLKTVLDVGCGTGLLEEAAQQMQVPVRIDCVDVSFAMLRQARNKEIPMAGSCWVNGVAEALPFRSAIFDAVVCANSFHHYRQPLVAAKELLRVLRPGGWLVVTDWCDDYVACRICDWVLRLVDTAHFRTYSMDGFERLLRQAGFRIDTARRFKIDWLWGLMTVRAIA